MVRPGVLFSQECLAETGLWCELASGIDPTQWARVCRFIGHLSAERFQSVCRLIHQLSMGMNEAQTVDTPLPPHPLVSLGPSGLGGEYQKEWE